MLVLTWLLAFVLAGFSLVDTIPRPNTQDAKTSDCLASLSSDIASARTIVKAATTPLFFGNPLYCAMRWLRAVFHRKAPQSNRLLLYKRQCLTPCKNNEYSFCCQAGQSCSTSNGIPFCAQPTSSGSCSAPCSNNEYSFCCEAGQFCSTSNGIPFCAISTSLESQGFPSTSSTPTNITPISLSQTTDFSSATKGSSSTTEKLPTTSSTLTTNVATPTTSAFPTQLSMRQSSSAASDTQTSTTGSSPSSPSLLASSVTSLSPSSSTSSTTPTSGPTTVSGPAAPSSGDTKGYDIALGVGIGVGLPATIATMVGAYYAVKLYYKPRL